MQRHDTASIGERAEGVAAHTRVVVRPIANPLTYGFLGVAVATTTVSGLDLGWIPTRQQHDVALVLLAFAFPAQLLSTIYAFLGRDTAVVSGIGLQSVGWLTFGLLLLTGAPGGRSATAATFLLAAGAALLVPACGAALGKVLPAAVITLASLRFVLTGLWERFGGTSWQSAAGWEGMALAAVAFYVALAAELESVLRRTVLPLGRHGRGRAAVQGSFDEEVTRLEREPGVREQL